MSEWVLVVDDDAANLRMASHILVGEGMRVSCVKSGAEALSFLMNNRPDIILLDVHMPGMDGFETLRKIRENEDYRKIPVIYLTADEDTETEKTGLNAGAMDFIKKPFVPEVMLIRVQHIIHLIHLQNNLAMEVEEKTREVVRQQEKLARISLEIVQALSGAIDAKDTYTNGHSTRVAEYAREIAKRTGYYSQAELKNIYMMGLLHDVGKIGIPDSIINKPARLSSDEFEQIMNHPVLGARILQNIREFPELKTGARWHHERYDGNGYPDGLKGEEIPEKARIIAVADAYDAMTSRRSYRDILSQETVRSEIEKGKGTQFDPVFADIMLLMMNEDPNYKMREH